MLAELYHRAEVRLRQQQKSSPAQAGASQPPTGPERLLHELEVHQIELEMQNTELRKARDELELALENYTDLYDFAPVGYFSLDESGTILEVNLTGAALLGLERSRLLNRRLLQFMAPTSRPIFLGFLGKTLTNTLDQPCEVQLFKPGGDSFWASCRATPAVALKGALKWCRVAVSDITTRQQAEALLRRNEALFTALIEQAPVGVYVVDEQLRLQQVNPRAQPVFDKIHALKGRDLSEIMRILWPEKTANKVVAHFRKTLQTGEPYVSPEFSEIRRDTGAAESYEWQLQRITLPGGQHGVVCFFTDITERRRVEGVQRRLEILKASNRKLEQEIIRRQAVEKALKESEQHQIALLGLSHRMQTQLRQLSRQVLHAQEEERKRISRELHDVIAQTLTSISVRLTVLKKEARLKTADFERSITRTQQLVEQSVDTVHQFARDLRPAVLDDLGLIPALHAHLKSFVARTGIRTSLTAFAGVEQLDPARRTVLFRVAQEALTNIARHSQASQAAVKIQKLKGGICMKIVDAGKGFRPERILPSKRRSRLGVLGMRERVEMVGGEFTIESVPGKGTTICAQLPFAGNLARNGKEYAVIRKRQALTATKGNL